MSESRELAESCEDAVSAGRQRGGDAICPESRRRTAGHVTGV